MESMAASVYVGDGVLEVHDVPVPTPGPGEVLIEIAQCGICGTDLHLVLERIARPGTVLGHEWAGTIAVTGDGSTGGTSAARRVRPRAGCGGCRACRGRPTLGVPSVPTDGPPRLSPGAFAGYVVSPADQLVAVPERPAVAAALTEPTTVALHGHHCRASRPPTACS